LKKKFICYQNLSLIPALLDSAHMENFPPQLHLNELQSSFDEFDSRGVGVLKLADFDLLVRSYGQDLTEEERVTYEKSPVSFQDFVEWFIAKDLRTVSKSSLCHPSLPSPFSLSSSFSLLKGKFE
jgi:hypothetical protein